MTDALASTRVTFPHGALEGDSVITAVIASPGGSGIITAETPFHPVDHTWPDQPGDVGTLTVAGREVSIRDCVTGAARVGSDEVLLGSDIAARRGDEDWRWFVVHLTDAPIEETSTWVGVAATLRVDAAHRGQLSRCHTGCHLMAFALNEALAPRWRKTPSLDSLGHPNFDAIAISSSRIGTRASTDTYRLGKSLRKKGFSAVASDDHPALAEDLDNLAATVTTRLNGWIATDAPVRVTTTGDDVTSPRQWQCDLPEGTAEVMCGGTHVNRLSELGSVHVSASLNEDHTELTIVTTPRA